MVHHHPPPLNRAKMLDLLTKSTQPTVARCLSNALAAHALHDLAALDRAAELALDLARSTRDERGQGAALLALGIARRDTSLVDAAARTFELVEAHFDTAIALCVRAAMERVQSVAVVLLDRALGYIRRAKRWIAQRGDTVKWRLACDLERAIVAGIERGVDGPRWIEGMWNARG